MGVPAFFRWLVEKYPKMVAFVLEERSRVVEGINKWLYFTYLSTFLPLFSPFIIKGTVIPVDLTQSNPDEIEYDNLYIDMNGILF